MKRWLILLTLALLPTVSSLAQNPTETEDPDITYASCLIAPGSEAPSFELPALDGKAVSLKDFAGKHLLLVFWASWCPDCRAEVPLLKSFYETLDREKAEMVGISFDRTEEKWREYVSAEAVPGVQLFDQAGKKESKVAAAYGVQWIPSLLVISPEGTVLMRTVVAERAIETLNAAL